MEDYCPRLVTVEAVRRETPDIRTLFLSFADGASVEEFSYRPGQFIMLSFLGQGECTFCLTQSPTRAEYIEASIKLAGRVTEEFHQVERGDTLGLRGPYGNSFPVEDWKGKNLVFVAGGIGMAPVRSVLNYAMDEREDYGHITVVYGARSPKDLCYDEERKNWNSLSKSSVHVAVDPPPKDIAAWPNWEGPVGFVPNVLRDVAPSSKDAICILCGPPIMIKFTLEVLKELGFSDEDIYTTLENRMQCGIGKCGRCNVGRVYVCKDGPVFTYSQLKELPNDF